MAETPADFANPGGLLHDVVGAKITAAATIAPTTKLHHVTGTTAISTITPPWEGFTGPLYLVADSVFSWNTGGNIGAANPTTVVASQAYGFLYDRKTAKWYSLAF
jgi:hypothetical protein